MNRERPSLWELVASQRRRYLAAVACLVAGELCMFLVPLVPGAAIDRALASGEAGWLDRVASALTGRSGVSALMWTGAGLIVLLTTVGAVMTVVRGRLAASAAEGVVRRIRERLMHRLVRLPATWHDGMDTGDVVQRCTSDVDTLRTFLSVQVVQIAQAAAMLACATPILFALDARLALASVALLPFVVAFGVVFFRRVQRLFQAVDEAEGRMTTVLQEALTGVRVVRAFGRGEHEAERFAKPNAEHRDLLRQLIQVMGLYWASSDLLCFGQAGVVLLYGAQRTLSGALSIGDWFAFTTVVGMFLWPVRQSGRVLAETGKALVSVRRLGDVLAATPEDAVRDEARALAERAGEDWLAAARGGASAARGTLSVIDVHFAYPGGEPVLRGLSLDVRAGETIALVGPPGAGKTTLVALLLRLYDQYSGAILVDGRPLRSLDREAARRAVALAPQEPFLFSRTLADNLRVADARAEEASLVGATTSADLADTLARFERGLETRIGERGVTLSGGQRQRLALARALLVDAPLLVLDDALSAVDTRTEARILAALDQRHGRRSTVIVAHRLTTVSRADRVFVLERGRVVQAGPPDELGARPGPYRTWLEHQGALEREIERDLSAAAAEEPST